MNTDPTFEFTWRHAILTFLILFPLLLLMMLEPIPQDPAFHNFVDTRNFLTVANFFDVMSNLAFLGIGTFGFVFCLNNNPGPARSAWLFVFSGVILVSFGSAYYHLSPTDETLVWDRLAMSIGFMGLLSALLTEYVEARLSILLAPLVVVGISSVVYWHFFDDLRLYAWVQFMPLLTILFVTALFRGQHTHQWLLLSVFGWYALAKLAEFYDMAVFQITGEFISGHTLKHLLAAIGCYSILLMLQKRKLKA